MDSDSITPGYVKPTGLKHAAYLLNYVAREITCQRPISEVDALAVYAAARMIDAVLAANS